MADESRRVVWGLWNERLGEWFNPGTRQPYFSTREEAQRQLPFALRQYNFGRWEVREYPLPPREVEDEAPPARGPLGPRRAA